MRVIKRIIIALLVIALFATTNDSAFLISIEQTVKASDEVNEADNNMPDEQNEIDGNIPDEASELSIWIENDETEVNRITIGWNEITNLSSIVKYELSLYKEDGSLVGSVIEVLYENEPAIDNEVYGGENWDYKYKFSDVEDGIYYCVIRVYSGEVDSEGNTDYVWSEYAQSETIVIENIVPMSFEIDSTDWTSKITPQITWSGVTVDVDGEVEIQYQINDGEWIDSGFAGESGSGTLDDSNFASDGEYKIKIRSKVDVTNEETGEIEIVFCEESEEVVYKRDVSAPTVDISTPTSAGKFEDTVMIKGSILDGGSGIKSWVLEYESNAKQGEWIKIASGDTEKGRNTTLARWNTSDLEAGFYTIRLKAIDNDGKSSVSTTSVTIEKVNNSGPVTPINVKTTLITDTKISAKVSWQDVQNSLDITYNVYRSYDADFTESTLVATDVADAFWVDRDILYGQEYYYKVSSKTQLEESETSIDTGYVKIDKMLGLEDYWTYISFDTSIGNGYINVANGNLVYNAVDSAYTDDLLEMAMQRIYNSQASEISVLGYGWNYSYNICLYQEKDYNNNLLGMILKDSDGSYHYFRYDSLTGTYTAPSGTFMELTFNCTTGEHIITIKDNVSYVFGDDLKIAKITNANEEVIIYQYDVDGKPTAIENSIGEQAAFDYYQQTDKDALFYTEDSAHVGLIAQMIDPYGKTYLYTYKKDEPILITATLGETSFRESYDYLEGTYQISKIQDSTGNQTVIDYMLEDDKISKITPIDGQYYELSYEEGITILTNSESPSTIYNYNEYGCATSIIDPNGDKTTYTYNDNLQVREVTYDNYIDGKLSTTGRVFSYDKNTGELLTITDLMDEMKLE